MNLNPQIGSVKITPVKYYGGSFDNLLSVVYDNTPYSVIYALRQERKSGIFFPIADFACNDKKDEFCHFPPYGWETTKFWFCAYCLAFVLYIIEFMFSQSDDGSNINSNYVK